MQAFVKFTLLTFLLVGTLSNIFAQNESIIVVNGGIYGTTHANTTIEVLNSGTAINMGTIGVSSIQDILIDGKYAYVAAQDSIVKYDWTTKTRVASNVFLGISTVKLALYNNKLLVGNFYEPWGSTAPYNKNFLIYDADDLSFVDSIPQVTKPVDDIVVIGDYAYIAQNSLTPLYQDTMGYLTVIDLSTNTWVRNDTLSTTGADLGRLVVEGDVIYAINQTSNTISSLNTVTFAKTTQATGVDLNPATYGPTAFSKAAGVWYFPFDSGIGSYDLAANAVISANIVNITGSFAFVMDTFNNNFCVSHINYDHQSQNKGRIYDMNGDSVGIFQVEYSPEALAIVSTVIVGTTVQLAAANELNYTIAPNPATSALNVNLEKAEAVTLLVINQVGQNVLMQQSTDATTTLDIAALPTGVYFLAVINEKGMMRTQRFVKQ